MMFDVVLETLATVSGIVSSFAMLPQIHRIFKRKSAKDLSIWTYAYMLVAGITNLIGNLARIGIIVGWILYGR